MMRTCLESYIQCWPMAEPVYGARYLKPAGSEAGAATIVVYSMAPASSSAPFTEAMVEPFWPIGDVDAANLLVDGRPTPSWPSG